MCVGHLNSEYLLVETEYDLSEDDMDRGGFSGQGQDFADPSPPPSPPTTEDPDYDPSFWVRPIRRH